MEGEVFEGGGDVAADQIEVLVEAEGRDLRVVCCERGVEGLKKGEESVGRKREDER